MIPTNCPYYVTDNNENLCIIMSALSFIKSTKGKVILATVAALHITIYFAKPSFFRGENELKSFSSSPKYMPEK